MLQEGGEVSDYVADHIRKARASVQGCPSCGFFIDAGGCAICSDSNRESTLICVVEEPTDVMPLERTGAFKGQYHVLGGKLSPLDNVSPEDLRIGPLVTRLKEGAFLEVILAVGSDVEGEATANYLAEVLSVHDVSVSRLAQGLPAGGGLEHADELTLYRALDGRKTL